MREEVFQDCLKHWKESDGHSKMWPQLAEQWGFSDGEKLRHAFKLERKRRGISRNELDIRPQKLAKILLFDIETTPLMVLSWGLWDQNIRTDAVIQDWHVLTWSAKWLFEDEILSDCLTPKEAVKHDDFRIVNSMWNLLDEADIVITHNGDSFDTKRLNTRFLYHKIKPPMSYQSIDTLKIARSNFNFSSNKLDYINEFLGLPKKTPTGFDLWKKCYFGDPESLKLMEEYNKNDVAILEDLYLKLRPYIKGHPNMNLWSTEDVSVCPNCGCPDLTWKNFYYTYTGRYRAFRCDHCGAVGRSRQQDLDKEKRRTVVR